MTSEPQAPETAEAGTVAAPQDERTLSPAAMRALAEAQERRAALDARAAESTRATELGGRGGPDPVRYADWESNGIASDF